MFVLKAFGLWAYVAAAWWSFYHYRHHSDFVRSVLVFFAMITIPFCLLEYGSAYNISWDYSRWTWSDRIGLFPLTTSNNGSGPHTISKSSVTYWIFLFVLNTLFLTFPQAVLKGAKKHLADKTGARILGIMSGLFGVGVGFLAVMATLTSVFCPYPRGNTVVMFLSFGFIVWMMGATVWEDLGDGIKKFVPGGEKVAENMDFLLKLAKLWR